MKKVLPYLAFTAILLTFYGCPSDFDDSLGSANEEKIEKKLLGNWATTNENSEVMNFTVTQKDDYNYKVEVTKRNDLLYGLETNTFTGWITKFEGQRFLILQPKNQEVYYHYSINELEANKLVTCEVSVNEEQVKNLNTRELLRKEVQTKIKDKDLVADAITWTKE